VAEAVKCPYCKNELTLVDVVSSRSFDWWRMNGSERDAVTATYRCAECRLDIDITLPMTVYPTSRQDEEPDPVREKYIKEE
jgi:hypothetical protein